MTRIKRETDEAFLRRMVTTETCEPQDLARLSLLAQNLSSRVASLELQIEKEKASHLRSHLDLRASEERNDRLMLFLGDDEITGDVEQETNVARAIDPRAWRWIDKVAIEEPDHPALPLTMKVSLETARAAIRVCNKL